MGWREQFWLKIGVLHFLVNLYVKERLVLDNSIGFFLLKPVSGHLVFWKHGCMPLVGAKHENDKSYARLQDQWLGFWWCSVVKVPMGILGQ